MNVKEITMGIVAVIVSLVIVVVCAIPIISDSVATEDTFENEGYFYVDKFSETTTFVFENSTLKINGEDVALPGPNTTTPYGNSISVAFTDNGVIRYSPSSNILLTRGAFGNHNCSALSLTFSEGAFTGTYTSASNSSTGSLSGTYTELTMIQDTGNSIMCYTSGAYINGDSLIDGCGFTSLTNNSSYVVVHLSGTYDDGVEIGVYDQNDGTTEDYVVSNIEYDITPVNGYIDLYRLTKITFTVSDEGGTVSDNVTYNIYTVPSEVTAERSVHVDGPTGSILAVIPVMMVLAILIGAVTLFIKTRRD